MRYIGSKVNLLEEISVVVNSLKKESTIFCDLFSGTGSVGRYFKKDFEIISNDLLYFSYVIQRATIQNQSIPEFKKLKTVIKKDPFLYFMEFDVKEHKFQQTPFIYENYSPTKTNDRQYLTNENALRVDAFRQLINSWKIDGYINDDEYFYLVAGLIESVPFVSNIAGTYGAYLKDWDKRVFKRLDPIKYPVENNYRKNKCFNSDANSLIKEISGDILYLDPPYNGRQYLSNYHLLETVARYDNPVIKGVTGTRKDNSSVSDYCKIRNVLTTFEDLIHHVSFKHIVISYSTEGIMSEEEIVDVLERNGIKKSLKIKKIPYRRYKRTNDNVESTLHELIFTIKK